MPWAEQRQRVFGRRGAGRVWAVAGGGAAAAVLCEGPPRGVGRIDCGASGPRRHTGVPPSCLTSGLTSLRGPPSYLTQPPSKKHSPQLITHIKNSFKLISFYDFTYFPLKYELIVCLQRN